ncbi:hypothetical protein HWV62_8699 [Athelia sp. TMB]|nr:hypothetical protein HWV62_8699 [Athelia sp. TMB]
MSTAVVMKDRRQPWVLDVSLVARAHTILASAAFATALFFALLLHYKKVVKNGIAGYPEEWWPSVSATIGDWYPERNLFQILIAVTSGPRFALVIIQYYLAQSATSILPSLVLASGLVRTLSCGGWVYITSSDDHDVHDVLMITYIVLNIPWMIGTIYCTPKENVAALRRRFFGSIVPLIYFFIQHKVHEIPGAYTHYSFFEWGLIVFDVAFDSVAELDFKAADIKITLGPLDFDPSEKAQLQTTSSDISTAAAVTAQPDAKDESPSQAAQPAPRLNLRFLSEYRPAVSFCADVYLSYIFWSIFTSLVPTLFFFSVWELAIAGSEAALLSTLSPILLAVTPLHTWCRTRAGQTTLWALSFLGLAAYAVDDPMQRLLLVAFAVICLNIRQAVSWTDIEGTGVAYQGILMGLGLIISSLSKHANHSNNPVWPQVNEDSGGYNKTGIALACLALYEFHTRPAQGPVATKKAAKASQLASEGSGPHWLAAAAALGGLIFSLHTLLSDSGTLIAWSWTGYADRKPLGPLPHLHGSVTLVAQALGLLIPIISPTWGQRILVHPIWFAYGCANAFIMYQYRNWLGYIGGLNLAVFLMSIIPHVLQGAALASKKGMPKTYFTAWLVACLLDLAGVWTVAYAFVPGGVYLRERTDIMPNRPPVPYSPGPRIITAGIWTIHFGIDNQGRDSQRKVRDLVHDMKVDVLGLLETDLHRIVYGNRDLTRVLIEELGYYPIINTTHHLLPSPGGELAPAIEAYLDVYGTEVQVVVAHNGQEEDPLDRELQARELARIMAKAYPTPTIFLGYVVTEPHAAQPAPYEIMVNDGRVFDVDEEDNDRWCEYIFYRGLYRTSYARISRGVVTDTELQVAQFVLPRHGHGVTDDSFSARMLRSFKEDLPEEHWLPMEYYGDLKEGGKNGHFYHVFNTVCWHNAVMRSGFANTLFLAVVL